MIGYIKQTAERFKALRKERRDAAEAKAFLDARDRAILAVVSCRDWIRANETPFTPDEGPLTTEGYLYVAQHPAEFFMCRSCMDGPWHVSWNGGLNRLKMLGPCCTGAD